MTKRPSTGTKAKGKGVSSPPISREESKAHQRAKRLIDRAMNGDVNALIQICKITGDLPKDYKLRY